MGLESPHLLGVICSIGNRSVHECALKDRSVAPCRVVLVGSIPHHLWAPSGPSSAKSGAEEQPLGYAVHG